MTPLNKISSVEKIPHNWNLMTDRRYRCSGCDLIATKREIAKMRKRGEDVCPTPNP